MNRANTYLLYLLMLLLLSKCYLLCNDDGLTLEKKNYIGSQLRINGYYFGDVNRNLYGVVNHNTHDPFAKVWYLYRNGVFYTSESANLDVAKSGDSTLIAAEYGGFENTFGKTVKPSWGVFQITGNVIEISRWRGTHGNCVRERYERGEVLNDTTFVITHREFRTGGKVNYVRHPNSIFRFRPLPYKPDSINPHIP